MSAPQKINVSHTIILMSAISAVPRCECVSQSDCQRGWSCEDCECRPGLEPANACDPLDEECSERKCLDF